MFSKPLPKLLSNHRLQKFLVCDFYTILQRKEKQNTWSYTAHKKSILFTYSIAAKTVVHLHQFHSTIFC